MKTGNFEVIKSNIYFADEENLVRYYSEKYFFFFGWVRGLSTLVRPVASTSIQVSVPA